MHEQQSGGSCEAISSEEKSVGDSKDEAGAAQETEVESMETPLA